MVVGVPGANQQTVQRVVGMVKSCGIESVTTQVRRVMVKTVNLMAMEIATTSSGHVTLVIVQLLVSLRVLCTQMVRRSSCTMKQTSVSDGELFNLLTNSY